MGNSTLSDDESGEVTGVFVGFCNNEWGHVSASAVIAFARIHDVKILRIYLCCR
jgi:hypothetical protein